LLVSCETSMSTVWFDYNAVFTLLAIHAIMHRHVAAYDADNKAY